jgi:omega-6 fatty acid desaturase (delta-12 desaturase)
MTLAGSFGIWLFYVQHQYDGVYWARHNEWDPIQAALEGSSYYKLPKILQWFSGNIGLHHIHHLRPRIPNYNLQQCQDETPALQVAPPLTLGRSLRSMFMNVWDEANGQLISFRALKRLSQQKGLPN